MLSVSLDSYQLVAMMNVRQADLVAPEALADLKALLDLVLRGIQVILFHL